MAVKCPKCYSENPSDSGFCGKCGTQLVPSEKIPSHTETLVTPTEELVRGKTFAGRYEEAVELSERLNYWQTGLAGGLALVGKREELRKMLNEMIEYSKRHNISSFYIAEVFSALGEKDQTFAWLEKAYREHDPYLLMYLKNHRRYDALPSDPRFTDLLQRIGLEK